VSTDFLSSSKIGSALFENEEVDFYLKLNESIMWIPVSTKLDLSGEKEEFPQGSHIFSYQDFVHCEFK